MSSHEGSASIEGEAYISVDVEAAGPVAGAFSMLSLGACLVGSENATFYVELKPINHHFVPEALRVSQLSLEGLQAAGRNPVDGMTMFTEWVSEAANERRPVFVGFNAAFDWQFVNWYFHTYLGRNPFGPSALDIKSYYMGLSGCLWDETSSSKLPTVFKPSHRQTHNALDDAVAQAEIFEKLLAARRRRA